MEGPVGGVGRKAVIQPLTLYELNRAFKQGISTFYSASYGSLQMAVKNLLAKGLVVFEERVDKGRNKKVYTITPPGREAFYAWMLAETPVTKLEVTALAKVFFLGLVPGAAQKKQIVAEILAKIRFVQDQLAEMKADLSQLGVPAAYEEIFKYQLLTLDYGLKAHAFARQWFQAVLNDLEASPEAEPQARPGRRPRRS